MDRNLHSINSMSSRARCCGCVAAQIYSRVATRLTIEALYSRLGFGVLGWGRRLGHHKIASLARKGVVIAALT